MHTCIQCGFTGLFPHFSNHVGRLTKRCSDCRQDRRQTRLARRNVCLLDRLPPGLITEIYELAGGRPVHPNARIMRKHVEETQQKLKDKPCFFRKSGLGPHTEPAAARVEVGMERAAGVGAHGFLPTHEEKHTA